MKKITFLILTVLFFSCKKESEKPIVPETKKIESDSLFYSSKDFQPYLKFNSEYTEYELTGLETPKEFTSSDLSFKVKENDYNFDKSADFKYFTTAAFNLDKIKYKVIAYATYGENDGKVINLQLNSYVSNIQVDALLLDCRFTFEIEYYRKFEIKKDGNITIKKYSIDGYTYNDAGDIIGKRATNDTVTTISRYKTNTNGQFIKY
ncbi:hypothetical protein [Flavobacterium sp. 7A]|uniref:hypothetical protein n=1 Tax=Flavobacterium sp. 7A TaxID=2940571 RepID=UPI002227880A|nr:hypothetical protein [Flavobacterium sp. 7A]MCW2120371.1 hypothetical protein [Flavobacterium sp. 7A]